MKKEMLKRLTCVTRKAALLLAAAMLLPMFAVGCESVQDMIKKRERADEVSKLAEQYMQEKYKRGFKVKKCEAAEGDEYKDDFFISFNSGVHAFYDSEEDMFYDDRQSEPINEALLRDVWLPMFEKMGLLFDYVNEWSQTFNMVYRYERGGKEYKYSMYNGYYDTTPEYYAVHNPISVTSDNLIVIAEKESQCKGIYDKINSTVSKYFKNQAKGDLNVFVVTSELHGKQDFEPNQIDETFPGCLARIHFGQTKYCSLQNFVKVTDGLYAMLCCNDSVFRNETVSLVPVEDYDSVSKKIVENMDSKDIGFFDQYTSKKREIDYENTIYKLELSDELPKQYWDEITVAFVMKDSPDPIGEYAEINEKSHSFFGYDMNGSEYNATCLCSPNSRSVFFTFRHDSEVYFWFGSQS